MKLDLIAGEFEGFGLGLVTLGFTFSDSLDLLLTFDFDGVSDEDDAVTTVDSIGISPEMMKITVDCSEMKNECLCEIQMIMNVTWR